MRVVADLAVWHLVKSPTIRHSLLPTCLALSVLLLATSPCPGQDSGPGQNSVDIFSLSLEELLNLKVVTTSKVSEDALATPAPITILTADELDLLGFNTLEETLEYATGISLIKGEGNVFTTLSIRGNTQVNYNTNTVLLLDGVLMNNPYAGSFDLAAIPMSAIASIEIVKGANSVLYGSNAINAVINIRSKQGDAGSSLANQVQLSAGRWQTLHGRVSLMTGDAVQASLFCDVLSQEGEPLPLEDEAGHQTTLNNELDTVSLLGRLSSGDFSLGARFYSRRLPNFRTRNFGFRQDNSEHQISLDLTHGHDFSSRWSSRIRLSYLNWQLDKEFTPAFTDRTGDFTWNFLGEYYLAEVEAHHHRDRSNLIPGASMSSNFGSRFKSNQGDYDIGKSGNRTFDLALYLNGDTRPSDRIEVVFGGRYYSSS